MDIRNKFSIMSTVQGQFYRGSHAEQEACFIEGMAAYLSPADLVSLEGCRNIPGCLGGKPEDKTRMGA